MSSFLSYMYFVKPFIFHKGMQSWPDTNNFSWQSNQNYPARVKLRTLFLSATWEHKGIYFVCVFRKNMDYSVKEDR